jgi:hypothetical protein
MSKIITTTFLLKNPAKVREMVAKGLTVLVKHHGEIVMQITIPVPTPRPKEKSKFPPSFTSGIKDFKFNREEIYDKKY